MAAFLAGGLAAQDRHGLLAIELARAAAGRKGLALALTGPAAAAIARAGIQPVTVAALDEAVTVLAAQPDRFAEMIVRRLRADQPGVHLLGEAGDHGGGEQRIGLPRARVMADLVRRRWAHPYRSQGSRLVVVSHRHVTLALSPWFRRPSASPRRRMRGPHAATAP